MMLSACAVKTTLQDRKARPLPRNEIAFMTLETWESLQAALNAVVVAAPPLIAATLTVVSFVLHVREKWPWSSVGE